MNLLKLSAVAVAAAAFGAARPVAAQSTVSSFLAPQQAVGVIMDGKPWSAKSGDGRNLTITLNKDGTGSTKGPMPFALSVSWEIKGEAICLHVGPAGTKCVRFRQVAGGFEGWNGNQLDLKLTR